jgi:hypothetical protein
MARRGRAIVHERFDRRQNIDQLVEIFAERGGQGPPPRELRGAAAR